MCLQARRPDMSTYGYDFLVSGHVGSRFGSGTAPQTWLPAVSTSLFCHLKTQRRTCDTLCHHSVCHELYAHPITSPVYGWDRVTRREGCHIGYREVIDALFRNCVVYYTLRLHIHRAFENMNSFSTTAVVSVENSPLLL